MKESDNKNKNNMPRLNPVSARIKEDVKAEENLWLRAFGLISPVIIYMLYVGLLTGLAGAALNGIADKSEEYAKYISNNRTIINAAIRTVVIIIASVAQIPAFISEKPVLVSGDGNLARYLKCIFLGIFSALMFNVLLSLIGLTGSVESYNELAKRQFALPLMLGIILYGIISPIAEELVFRGLVYNRMRRNEVSVPAAIILSSLFFGIYHFNMVQAVYGVLMGLIMVCVYEKYGGFIYPVIIHAVANSFIYILSSNKIIGKLMTPVTVAVTGALSIWLFISIICENQIRD
ncbi:MAG: CPBP family intramembrane metalloprotease [Lachnospiraceae bacterium]|nr:CPBP family intramembrane metalloprotease [Lachnospiraceae bacterium]